MYHPVIQQREDVMKREKTFQMASSSLGLYSQKTGLAAGLGWSR
jgi:hypothetical protein